MWAYLKQYTENIPGIRYLEGELACILPNGATIKLYGGAAAYERMRGMYFDGIALDEYPLLNPAVFSTVVRPCLADYHGFGIVSGTSNGDDHFNQLRLKVENDPRWDPFIIPLSATGEDALTNAEALELTQDMSPEEYAREMECAFDAPVEGSYYGEILNKLAQQGRICSVPVDLSAPVITAWDLGIHDYCCIWLYQIAGKEIHFIDYIQDNGKGLDFYAQELRVRAKKGGFVYKCPLPAARRRGARDHHRAKPPDLPRGAARRADRHRPVRRGRGRHCRRPRLSGDELVRRGQMQAGPVDAARLPANKMGNPVHGPGPHSHGADAYRTFACTFHLVGGLSARGSGPLRRKIRGIM